MEYIYCSNFNEHTEYIYSSCFNIPCLQILSSGSLLSPFLLCDFSLGYGFYFPASLPAWNFHIGLWECYLLGASFILFVLLLLIISFYIPLSIWGFPWWLRG